MTIVADHTKSEEFADIHKKLGMTVPKLAEKLGVKRTTLHNWIYGRSDKIPDDVMNRARKLLEVQDIGPFTIPASQLLIPVVHIGTVAASSMVNWTDPFESETFEYVPLEMGDAKGRFSCTIGGDSMLDLLWPGDVCVFQCSDIPRIGHVVLFRSFDHRITVKELKHTGKEFVLHPLNSSYEDIPAEGSMVGYLVGIVRQDGSRRITIYDPNGIRP